MLRIHLFSIFMVKPPPSLAALSPIGLLIVKTLTNVLYLFLTITNIKITRQLTLTINPALKTS